ncbi:MAG: BrnT family toxin [Treponema sp.]|nr:BrnT family toxin [Treponema sp.]
MFDLGFEWDTEKEQENFREHGIDFNAAERVFLDYFRMERHDDDSSDYEDRWQTMGFYNDVLFVVYTERGDAIRIISARVAEPFERRIYHGNSETHGWQRVNP